MHIWGGELKKYILNVCQQRESLRSKHLYAHLWHKPQKINVSVPSDLMTLCPGECWKGHCQIENTGV